MLATIYVVTTMLSTLYIAISAVDNMIEPGDIDLFKMLFNFTMLFYTILIINWMVTPVVLLDIWDRFKKKENSNGIKEYRYNS